MGKDTSKKRPKKKKAISPNPPTMEERELTAQSLSNTSEPLNYLTGMERLNAIPDYTKELKGEVVAKTYAKYVGFTKEQLNEAQKDPNNTILEISIIRQLIKVVKGEPDKTIKATEYIHNRIEGKTKERVEYSGPGGGPIHTKSTSIADIDYDNLSDKDLEKIKASIKGVQSIVKKANDDSSSED